METSTGIEPKKNFMDLQREHANATYDLLALEDDENVSETQLAKVEETFKALATKADNCGYMLEQLAAVQELFKVRREKWQRAERTAKNAIERLRHWVKWTVSQSDSGEIMGEEVRFYLTKPTEKIVIDESKIPREFMKLVTSYIPDKERIEESVKAGIEISGVTRESIRQLRTGTVKK